VALSQELRETRRRHIVEAAQALIRERGDAGFAMTELAARAGVSPATPYNLVGSKADLLRLVVGDEFESFSRRMDGVSHDSPLGALLDATALVVTHYEADRQFYRGLYGSVFAIDATDMRGMMAAEGQNLWCRFVQAAVDAGEIEAFVAVLPLTHVLLRAIGATAQAWLAENWDEDRFALEMAQTARLVLASVVSAPLRARLVSELAAAQARLLEIGLEAAFDSAIAR
jgi:AcrR family transcriptional regulator